MTLSIRNLDAPLGTEVSGIDLSKPVALGDVETIEDVWRERLVVVFHARSSRTHSSSVSVGTSESSIHRGRILTASRSTRNTQS